MTNRLHLPATSGVNLSTPDATALDITGDIWIAGRFELDDWTPASDQTLIAKWEDTSDQRSFRLLVDTTGVLRLEWTTAGTAVSLVSADSTVAPTAPGVLWAAATLDVSTGDVKFYTGGASAAPGWFQLGAVVSGAGATSIHSGSAVLEVGSDNTGTAQLLAGGIYNVQVRTVFDDTSGTLVFDADVTGLEPDDLELGTFVEQSSNKATVTINGSTWAYVRPIERGILTRAELLLQAHDGNKGKSALWADRSGNEHHATNSGALFQPFDNEKYVYVPEVAGNYITSPSVNLFDADTAHTHQTIANWQSSSNTTVTATPVVRSAPFGTKVLECTVSADGAESKAVSGGTASTDGAAVSVSTQYTVALTVDTGTASRRARVSVTDYDSGDVAGDTSDGSYTNLVVGTFTEIVVTHTTASDAAWLLVTVEYDNSGGNVSAGERWWQSSHMLAAGADGTFYPSVNIVGTVDASVKLSLADVTDSTAGFLMACTDDTANRQWYLEVSSKIPKLVMSPDGTDGSAIVLTCSTGIDDIAVNNVPFVLRVTGQPTNGANSVGNFYIDGSQLGTADVTSSLIASIHAGNSEASIGGMFSGTLKYGSGVSYYWYELRDGDDGPIVARWQAREHVEPYETSTSGEDSRTWTINRSGAALVSTVIDRDTWMLTTNDYFSVADHADLDFADGEDFTLLAVARTAQTPASWARLIQKRTGAAAGYQLQFYNDGASLYAEIEDTAASVISDVGDATSLRELFVAALRRDDTTPELELFLDGTGTGTPATGATIDLSTTEVFTIGANNTGGEVFEGEMVAVALFREALTDTEVAEAGNELKSNHLTGFYDSTTTITVEAALGAKPAVGNVPWTDITTSVRSFHTRRGRSHELDDFQPGTAAIVLANDDGAFDPDNTASTHSPDLQPMTPIRIRAHTGASVYPLFRGYADGWFPAYTHDDDTVTLKATDGFRILNSDEDSSTQASGLSGARVGSILDAVSWSSSLRDIGTGNETLKAYTPDREPPLYSLRTVELSEGGQLYVDAAGQAKFEARHLRAQQTVSSTFGDSGSELKYRSPLRVARDTSQIWNRVEVTIADSTAGTVVNSTVSQDAYTVRKLPVQDTLHTSSTAATDLANVLLVRYKDPKTRVEKMQVLPEEAGFTDVLPLDVSSKIRVKRRARGGQSVTVDAYVEGVEHDVTINPRKSWVTKLSLSQYE